MCNDNVAHSIKRRDTSQVPMCVTYTCEGVESDCPELALLVLSNLENIPLERFRPGFFDESVPLLVSDDESEWALKCKINVT